MIERGRPGGERLHHVAQAAQPGELGEQQAFEVALAGPGIGAIAHAAVAVMGGDDPVHDATIERFQKTVKRGTKKGHGRPPKSMFAHMISSLKSRRGLLCTLTHPKNPGQQCAFAGMTMEMGRKGCFHTAISTRPFSTTTG